MAADPETTPRFIPPGSCSWCGHQPHGDACRSKIRVGKGKHSPCPLRKTGGMSTRAWCSARTSKRCLADSGLRREGPTGSVETSGAALLGDLRLCVSCRTYACPPCSVELPDGEWECKPCARRDVAGVAS